MKLLLAILSTPISLPLVAVRLGMEMWARRLERMDRWSKHKVKRLRS